MAPAFPVVQRSRTAARACAILTACRVMTESLPDIASMVLGTADVILCIRAPRFRIRTVAFPIRAVTFRIRAVTLAIRAVTFRIRAVRLRFAPSADLG
jgi:hypothetical protein